MKYFTDYYWKDGAPRGLSPIPPESKHEGISYKIVADPYNKRISLEKYDKGQFLSIIYDSALFDFRHLKPREQYAWQKATIEENDSQTICHIRNQDDRLILIEEYLFEENRCRECRAKSPHGLLISKQKILYKDLNDAFDGVILFDSNNHPIMLKKYKVDELSKEFTELLEEQWNMINNITL